MPPLSSIWSKHTASFTISWFYTTISTVSAFGITVPANGSNVYQHSQRTLSLQCPTQAHTSYHWQPLTSQEHTSFSKADLQHLAPPFFLYSTYSGPPSISASVAFWFPSLSPECVPFPLCLISVIFTPLESEISYSEVLPEHSCPKSITCHFSLTPLIFQSPTGSLSPPAGMDIEHCQYQRPLS